MHFTHSIANQQLLTWIDLSLYQQNNNKTPFATPTPQENRHILDLFKSMLSFQVTQCSSYAHPLFPLYKTFQTDESNYEIFICCLFYNLNNKLFYINPKNNMVQCIENVTVSNKLKTLLEDIDFQFKNNAVQTIEAYLTLVRSAIQNDADLSQFSELHNINPFLTSSAKIEDGKLTQFMIHNHAYKTSQSTLKKRKLYPRICNAQNDEEIKSILGLNTTQNRKAMKLLGGPSSHSKSTPFRKPTMQKKQDGVTYFNRINLSDDAHYWNLNKVIDKNFNRPLFFIVTINILACLGVAMMYLYPTPKTLMGHALRIIIGFIVEALPFVIYCFSILYFRRKETASKNLPTFSSLYYDFFPDYDENKKSMIRTAFKLCFERDQTHQIYDPQQAHELIRRDSSMTLPIQTVDEPKNNDKQQYPSTSTETDSSPDSSGSSNLDATIYTPHTKDQPLDVIDGIVEPPVCPVECGRSYRI